MLEKFYARVFLFGGWLIGPLLIYASVSDLTKTLALGEGSAVVQARVVDARVRSGVTIASSPEVRYAFDIDGVTYTYTNPVGERDRWAVLTPDAYERAQGRRSLAVRYDPSDPWKNQPVGEDSVPVWLDVLGILAGAVWALMSLMVVAAKAFTAYDDRRRRSAAADPEGT